MRILTITSLATTIFLALLPLQFTLSQDTDLRSYRLGALAAWSEAVSIGVKELALSAPATPEEMDALIGDGEGIAARFGIGVYRETDLLVTDLFPVDVAEGKQVLLLYRPPTLDKYLALKQEKAKLIESEQYFGVAREEIARRFGRLLGYPASIIDQKLVANGVEQLERPTFSAVWKSPGIALDDQDWSIADLACRNGCSLVSNEYLKDLIFDPANDDTSVVDLYNDTQEFNRNYVASLIRPNTLQSMANYDASNDAALDCTPEGDGLQHQLTAPPAIEFEQRADRVLIKYEFWNAVREIFLDDSVTTPDIEPTRLGHSVGRVEDGVLVVDTTNLIPSQISLMGNKFYLSEAAKFIERYTMSKDGMRLELEWTVIDPVNLRGPYTGVMAWLRAPGWELHEWRCEAITGEF
jgi:hypothetical protein